MNVRGERILLVSDEIAPAGLIASALAAQGAAATRVNARSGRNMRHFFSEPGITEALAADQAFAPTRVVLLLGTHDVGNLDPTSLERLRDAYAKTGAEVWAVGPFVTTRQPAAIGQVAKAMDQAFDPYFVDGRPNTETIARAADGLSYPAAGQQQLALVVTDALLSHNPSSKWGRVKWGLVGIAALGALWYLARRIDRGAAGRLFEAGAGISGSADQRYRVAYVLVTKRGPVRAIVEAPRALTLVEAEKWRRKWGKTETAWIETVDGEHVPVKGAARLPRFQDDAKPGDVHWTLTTDRKLEGLGLVHVVNGKRFLGTEAQLVRSGARAVPCASKLDASGKVKCWKATRVLAGPDRPIFTFGPADVDPVHAKRLRAAMNTYRKHLHALEAGDRDAFDAAVKARGKLEKLADSGEIFSETARDQIRTVISAHRIGEYEEAGRKARAAALDAERLRLHDEGRAAAPRPGSFEHELAVERGRRR